MARPHQRLLALFHHGFKLVEAGQASQRSCIISAGGRLAFGGDLRLLSSSAFRTETGAVWIIGRWKPFVGWRSNGCGMANARLVIASFGFNRTTIYRWLEAASKPGVGLNALRSRPATGRPRRLKPRQKQQVFRWINGRDPRQHGLDFGLWTRSLVSELIEQKFHIRLGVTAVGALLAKLGLTPQPATGVSA